jgi:predicted acetyltransferase
MGADAVVSGVRLDAQPLIAVGADEAYAGAYLEMCRDYARSGEEGYPYRSLEEVHKRIEFERALSRGDRGRVPSDCYWFMQGGAMVGTSRLRTKLDERFSLVGGHVGYDVAPSFRKRGIGTAILAATLRFARDAGLREVLVTCDEGNAPSRAVIERNGGRFLGIVAHTDDGTPTVRYSIALPS